jgi:hypothetical protein
MGSLSPEALAKGEGLRVRGVLIRIRGMTRMKYPAKVFGVMKG